MSLCTFLAAGCELPEKDRPEHSTLEIDLERNTVFDGNAADNYGLFPFHDFDGHTELPYAVCLEWNYFTPGRAKNLIKYISAALENCARVELWHVWLTGYCEYVERPYRKTKTVSIRDLTVEDIQDICEFNVWANDKNKPTDACLIITAA